MTVPEAGWACCAPGQLHAQIAAVLRAWGMSEDVVAASADGLLYADLHGIDSHGVAMLPIYERWLAAGRFRLQPQPRVERESAATAVLDGDHAMGFLPATQAMRLAMAKCRDSGVAVVTVRRSNHFGAAGYYAGMAAQAGLVGFATSNTVDVAVVPTKAREARFGTNPLAFAAPATGQRPFLLDMATSTVALGKLMTAAYRHEEIPEGWALDEAGRPTTDPARAYAARRATPLGGTAGLSSHKGYGLAAMVEVLSSALTGARWAPAPESGAEFGPLGNVGHFFLALDPAHFREADALAGAVATMAQVLRATPAVEAGDPVLVAGDPEYDAHDRRQRDGVPLPPALLEALRAVAQRCAAPWLLT